MKIAFISTRGIPNNYGGFEQFAEYISVGLAKRGHEVTVYSPHFILIRRKLIKESVLSIYIVLKHGWGVLLGVFFMILLH